MSKKLLLFLSIILSLVSCRYNNQSSSFWNSITIESEYRPFVFVFSNTDLPICADHAQPKLQAILNNTIDSIEGEFVNGVMMYPALTDIHYSNIAEEIKFVFDNNGNETLETTPAFFSNMQCHNIDTLELYQSIITQRQIQPDINLGIKSSLSQGNLKVYVKGSYNKSFSASSHRLAVYSYRKSELANQATDEGTSLFTMKNKVVSALTPSLGKDLDAAAKGDEFREILTLDLSGETLDNTGIVAVIYTIEEGIPVSVANSIKLENHD
ncbi:MAG: hypothetical protein CMP61_03370 [Flavobacteriales bacterium]|nr:hypothetical protein [Flavobacteriales bacterium]